MIDSTVDSVNSALKRARANLQQRMQTSRRPPAASRDGLARRGGDRGEVRSSVRERGSGRSRGPFYGRRLHVDAAYAPRIRGSRSRGSLLRPDLPRGSEVQPGADESQRSAGVRRVRALRFGRPRGASSPSPSAVNGSALSPASSKAPSRGSAYRHRSRVNSQAGASRPRVLFGRSVSHSDGGHALHAQRAGYGHRQAAKHVTRSAVLHAPRAQNGFVMAHTPPDATHALARLWASALGGPQLESPASAGSGSWALRGRPLMQHASRAVPPSGNARTTKLSVQLGGLFGEDVEHAASASGRAQMNRPTVIFRMQRLPSLDDQLDDFTGQVFRSLPPAPLGAGVCSSGLFARVALHCPRVAARPDAAGNRACQARGPATVSKEVEDGGRL